MPTGEAIRKLVRAYAEIKDVRGTLCNAVSLCPACGCKKYDDRQEWQDRQALDACLGRLAKIIRRLKEESRSGSVKDRPG